MESKESLDWSEDPFNSLESVTWMKLDLVESYWRFDDTLRTLLKNWSLFPNHRLFDQIQFSRDMFLKKIQFVRTLPPTNEEILTELPHMKLSTILQRNSPLVSQEEMRNMLNGSISFDWIIDRVPCCLKKPPLPLVFFYEKQIWDNKSSLLLKFLLKFWIIVPNSS